jgi:hypothetical protein
MEQQGEEVTGSLRTIAVKTALDLAKRIEEQHPHGYMASASDVLTASATILTGLLLADPASLELL